MILFSVDSARKIINGQKWQTRRMWYPSYAAKIKPGSLHNAQLKMMKPETCFARLRIKSVWEWDGWTIPGSDLRAEGFENDPMGFFETYRKLNEKRRADSDRRHYAVEFEVVNTCPECTYRKGCETHNLFDEEGTVYNYKDISQPKYQCCRCEEWRAFEAYGIFCGRNAHVCRYCEQKGE